MKVSAPAGDPAGNGGLRSILELVGDFDVWVDYSWVAYDGSGDARSGLLTQNPEGSDRVYLNCHRWSSGSSREIILHHDGSNVAWVIGSAVPLSGKLRIRREETMFYGYYWASDNWSLLGSVNAFASAARPEFSNNNHRHNYPPAGFEVHWDNFHAEADQIIPEPATVLLFGLGGLMLHRKRRV